MRRSAVGPGRSAPRSAAPRRDRAGRPRRAASTALDLSPTEAVAIAVALYGLAGTPLHADAASALRKLAALMPTADAAVAHDLAGLAARDPTPTVPRVVADALHDRTVLRIDYADRHGTPTTRSVEPLGYIGVHEHWYLVAWCRLRQAVRAFRTDRIESLVATGEPAPPRRLAAADLAAVLSGRSG